LKEARSRRDESRRLLAAGIDLTANRKAINSARADRAANSFEVVAREWLAKYSPGWAENHTARMFRLFERYMFPWIGARPIADIAAPELLDVMRRIESRGALDTAYRALNNCGQVFRYGVATGRCERDPSGNLRGALPPPKKGHFAAVTEPQPFGEILRALDDYKELPRCVVPSDVLRWYSSVQASYAKPNGQSSIWMPLNSVIRRARMAPITSSPSRGRPWNSYVKYNPQPAKADLSFREHERKRAPRAITRSLVQCAEWALHQEEMSGHGFRAAARTILEVLGVRPDFIEHQLAHAVRDPNGRAYNRTAHLPERRKIMQRWADYLDKLKSGEPTQTGENLH
jgi:integrase